MPSDRGKTDDEGKLDAREQAVHEHRVWVRITYSCNNRCIFCLDGDVPGKGHRSETEVLKEIDDGFRPGARLIVSGGEASIHPLFLRFLEHGRRRGYAWIQTITNGRMFAYDDFTRKAVEAGLNEATFSMHGHTAEIHDELVGIPGAFAQALRGMRNLLRSGRVVVNVDIVINGLNYRHLPEILSFYMKLGIHEFDLLHVVPFGRAWWPENRERMLYDLEDAFPYINEGFKIALKPENYIWTNRFPVAFLEGVEELIQDPHKLFDETNGRRGEFARFVESGKKLQCFGERCRHCFIRDFCGDLYDLRDRLKTGDFRRLEFDLRRKPPISPKRLRDFMKGDSSPFLRILSPDWESARPWLSEFGGPWELFLENWENLPEEDDPLLSRATRLVTDDPERLDALLKRPQELEILVTNRTRETLLSRRESLSARGGVTLTYPGVETLSEARELLPEPGPFFEAFRDLSVRVRGVPRCLHENAEPDPETLRTNVLDEDGRIVMERFTRDYILNGYFATSNRCRACRHRESCPGLHINAIRVHGFRQLNPVP